MEELIKQLAEELARKAIPIMMIELQKEFNRMVKDLSVYSYTEKQAAEKLNMSQSQLAKIRKEGGIGYTIGIPFH